MNIFLACVSQIPEIILCLFSPTIEIHLDMESNNDPVMCELTNEVLNSKTAFLKILEA